MEHFGSCPTPWMTRSYAKYKKKGFQEKSWSFYTLQHAIILQFQILWPAVDKSLHLGYFNINASSCNGSTYFHNSIIRLVDPPKPPLCEWKEWGMEVQADRKHWSLSITVTNNSCPPSLWEYTPFLSFSFSFHMSDFMHPLNLKWEAAENPSQICWDRSFSFIAPSVCNLLPVRLHNLPILSEFKTKLKTFLFQQAFPQN